MNRERLIVAFVLSIAFVTLTQIASVVNQWRTNREVVKLKTAITGLQGDWSHRVPLTVQAEEQTRKLEELSNASHAQQQKVDEFIELSRDTLSSIQSVAEIQVGRGGRIKRVEQESKERDKANADDIEELREQLKNIKWIISTQSPDIKGARKTTPKRK